MIISGNNFKDALCTVEERKMTLYEINFYRNEFGSLTKINLNLRALIMSTSVIGNKISKNAYHVGRRKKNSSFLHSVFYHGEVSAI